MTLRWKGWKCDRCCIFLLIYFMFIAWFLLNCFSQNKAPAYFGDPPIKYLLQKKWNRKSKFHHNIYYSISILLLKKVDGDFHFLSVWSLIMSIGSKFQYPLLLFVLQWLLGVGNLYPLMKVLLGFNRQIWKIKTFIRSK